MKEEAVNILIVEDQQLISFGIKKALHILGYEVVGMLANGEDVLPFLIKNDVDLILMDIGLAGKLDGYETAIQVNKSFDIPIIYLTGQLDEESYNKAFVSKFAAYITKPFEANKLGREIKRTLFTHALTKVEKETTSIKQMEFESKNDNFITDDYLLIFKSYAYVKVKVKHIIWVKSEKEYCIVKLEDGEYVVRNPLKDIIGLFDKVAKNQFLRIHRSYLINLKYATTLSNQTNELTVSDLEGALIGKVPVGRNYKQDFLNTFNKLR